MFNESTLEKFNKMETPFYYYDISLLKKTLAAASIAAGRYGYEIHFAVKANTNNTILKEIRDAGFGADCVSGNEVLKAIELDFPREKIVFAGVGKSDKEILNALEGNIFCFNVESIQELEVLNELAGKVNKIACIALRLNPNVNAKTHHHITTGLEENKFGINEWELDKVVEVLKRSEHLQFTGLHFHIGSQILDNSVFEELCNKVNDFQQWFMERGFKLPHLNLGGGLGVDYHEPDQNSIVDFESYFKVFEKHLIKIPGQKIHFELGRALVAACGTLVSRVLFIKEGIKTNFVILDAGMTELMRPALYQAYHKIENLSAMKRQNASQIKYDVVGPICESTDCFAKGIKLPETKRGDVIAIRTSGAYGEVMSSNYNLREKVKSLSF